MAAVGLKTIFLSFLVLGSWAFGGPAMVVYIEYLAVDRHHWIGRETAKDGIALCQSIPGATAMQMATYVGLQIRGVQGGAAAFAGFVLPACTMMTVLAALYVGFRGFPLVEAAMAGMKVVVVGIVAKTVITVSKENIRGIGDIGIGVGSAGALFLGLNPFFLVVGAALAAALIHREKKTDHRTAQTTTMFHVKHLIVAIGLCGIGLALVAVTRPGLAALGVIFAKIDLFAFGGGFAALPLMFHEIVIAGSLLDEKTFMDGIALGQVTPGPIVITATFIGYLLYGLPGALVASVAVFAPSFVIVTAGTAFLPRLRNWQYFQVVKGGLLACFAGLLFFVTIQFFVAIDWTWFKVILGLGSFVALERGIAVPWVIMAGTFVSVLFLR